nr:MAG TPA: hypothetical protein [Caudoviricetes sp.]
MRYCSTEVGKLKFASIFHIVQDRIETIDQSILLQNRFEFPPCSLVSLFHSFRDWIHQLINQIINSHFCSEASERLFNIVLVSPFFVEIRSFIEMLVCKRDLKRIFCVEFFKMI